MQKRTSDLPPLKLEPGKFYRAHDQSTWCCVSIETESGHAICTRVSATPLSCISAHFTPEGIYEGVCSPDNRDLTLMEEISAKEASGKFRSYGAKPP